LVYFVESRDEETARVVDPRGLTEHSGRTYLDAFCHAAEAPRWFRLDRIRTAEVLESRVTTPTGSPRDLADGLFTTDDEIATVTLDLAPEAHWVTEYYSVLDVRPGEDGHAEVDLRVADQRWLTRLLLRLAPHARVVHPTAYSEAFQARARSARDLYR
jgi:proteasome accessory factor C